MCYCIPVQASFSLDVVLSHLWCSCSSLLPAHWFQLMTLPFEFYCSIATCPIRFHASYYDLTAWLLSYPNIGLMITSVNSITFFLIALNLLGTLVVNLWGIFSDLMVCACLIRLLIWRSQHNLVIYFEFLVAFPIVIICSRCW